MYTIQSCTCINAMSCTVDITVVIIMSEQCAYAQSGKKLNCLHVHVQCTCIRSSLFFQSPAEPMLTDFQSELATRLGVQPAPMASESPAAKPGDEAEGEGEGEEGERRPSKKKKKKKKKSRSSKTKSSRSRTSSKLSHSSRKTGMGEPTIREKRVLAAVGFEPMSSR